MRGGWWWSKKSLRFGLVQILGLVTHWCEALGAQTGPTSSLSAGPGHRARASQPLHSDQAKHNCKVQKFLRFENKTEKNPPRLDGMSKQVHNGKKNGEKIHELLQEPPYYKLSDLPGRPPTAKLNVIIEWMITPKDFLENTAI